MAKKNTGKFVSEDIMKPLPQPQSEEKVAQNSSKEAETTKNTPEYRRYQFLQVLFHGKKKRGQFVRQVGNQVYVVLDDNPEEFAIHEKDVLSAE